MARSITLATLRTNVRSRADMASAGGLSYITDAELNSWINSSYCELYDLLIDSGLAYFESTQTITTDGTNATYALPSDYYGTLRVDYQIDSQTWDPLPALSVRELHRVVNTGQRAFRYRITGTNVTLYPKPVTGQTYRHIYIPAPTVLVNDSDTIDGVSGWEAFVEVDAAIKARIKEESDTTQLERERDRLLGRIQTQAQNRAASGDAVAFTDAWASDFEVDPADWRWR